MESTVIHADAGKANAQKRAATHFAYLDGLRGLAALYVVLHHFLLWSAPGLPIWIIWLLSWTQFGHFAVDIFITLSGFCLMLPIATSSATDVQGGLSGFVGRRARRILPPYWAALTFAIIVAWCSHSSPYNSQLTVGNIVSHFLLLHDMRATWSESLDMAMWSIAPEWQIYFVFALVLLPIWRRFGSLITAISGFALGIIPHLLLKPGYNFDWACPWYIGLFALGMAGATMVFSPTSRLIWPPKRFLWLALLLLIPYAATKSIGGSTLSDQVNEFEWVKDVLGGVIAQSFIIYCALSAKSSSDITTPFALRLLKSRPVVLLGTFSYSLYLVHCIVLMEFVEIQKALNLSPMHALLLRAAVGIPSAILFAYLFFLVFERPFLVKRKTIERVSTNCDAPLSPASQKDIATT
jgi:peptidoglycan/LPS O-acetylase OafA/YrhL